MQQYFLSILSILSAGYFTNSVLSKYLLKENFVKRDTRQKLVDSLITGSFILITQMLFIGIFWPGNMQIPVYLFYGFGNLLTLFYFLRYMLNLQIYSSARVRELTIYFNDYRVIITIFVVLFTTVSLFLTERGWDALNFYFPNSLFLFLSDGFNGKVNQLSFFPLFKPPSNVMLMTFSLYTTKGFYAHLIPTTYFIAFALYIYRIGRLSFHNPEVSYISVITYFMTPLSILLIYDYAFYQDIFVGVFITAGIYYYLEYTYNRSKISIPLMAIAFALAVLSKLSGFLFLVILIMSMPSLLGKRRTIAISIPVFVILMVKAAEKIFVGTAFVIFILMIVQIALIWYEREDHTEIISDTIDPTLNPTAETKETSDEMNSTKVDLVPVTESTIEVSYLYLSRSERKWILLALFVPLIALFLWLNFMLQVEGIQEFLVRTYVSDGEFALRWSFPETPVSAVFPENGMKSSFLASILTIFTAHLFVGAWVIFKFVGLIRTHFQHFFLLRWTISFYAFWLAYHSTTSMRYLTPILAPITLITAYGMVEFKQGMDVWFAKNILQEPSVNRQLLTRLFLRPFERFQLLRDRPRISRFFPNSVFYYLVLVVGALYIWPSVPFEFSQLGQSLTLYSYYTNQLRGFLYTLGILTIITILYLLSTRLNTRQLRRTKTFTLLLLVIAPAVPLGYMFVASGYNLENMRGEFIYYSRDEYQELIDYMEFENLPPRSISVGVNIPGLQYFIQRPVIDLMYTTRAEAIDTFDGNYTKLLETLESSNFQKIIVPNQGHLHYENYIRSYAYSHYLIKLRTNPKLFALDFNNSEFQAFSYRGVTPLNPGMLTISIPQKLDFLNTHQDSILNRDDEIRVEFFLSTEVEKLHLSLNSSESFEMQSYTINRSSTTIFLPLSKMVDDKLSSITFEYVNSNNQTIGVESYEVNAFEFTIDGQILFNQYPVLLLRS